jgi:hypothetical protein
MYVGYRASAEANTSERQKPTLARQPESIHSPALTSAHGISAISGDQNTW